MSTSRSTSVPSDFKPMGVDDVTFLVDRLGEDCAPLQFVRELTQNAIAAVLLRTDHQGHVTWDVDWNQYELADSPTYKLAIIDNGVGMTGEEMVGYINNLSSSIHLQSKAGNYGVGAKIAAAPHNHEGLVYLSWKDGKGCMIKLCRDPKLDQYGLKKFSHPGSERSEYWAYVEDSIKPEGIDESGTMVVLLGKSRDQDTIRPPEGTSMPSRWILRYLNSRYFRFPKGVTVRAREGWDQPRGDSHNFLRNVGGMESWLAENSEVSGAVPLRNASARWWIIKQDVDRDSGHVIPNGHTAALFQNEIYEVSTGRAGVARLQLFGVIFGYQRVVIYVEPTTEKLEDLLPNTARTTLALNGAPLPWEEWAAEFSQHMPAKLVQFVGEAGANAVATDHSQSIRDRLKQIRDLLKISRYRKAKDGQFRIAADQTIPGGAPAASGRTGLGSDAPPERPGGTGGKDGDIYSLFLTSGDTPAKEVESDVHPERRWISREEGTRTPPDLDDRAAKYLPEKNLILINRDFRVFTDMVKRWKKQVGDVPGSESVIVSIVEEWFEQQLVEAVLGAQALRRSTEWTSDDLAKIWNEEALTAVVLPRYHVDNNIKRTLGAKLGAFKKDTG